MIQLTLNGTEFLFVGIPEGAEDFYLIGNNLNCREGIAPIKNPDLPTGSWTILFPLSEALNDETLAQQIVEDDKWLTKGFRDYNLEGNFDMVGKSFIKATNSLRSLISKHSIPINSLVLKKIA